MTSCEASVDDDCTIDVATCSKQFLKGTHYRLHHTPPYEMMKQKEMCWLYTHQDD
jgi:hypothetical protein